MAGMQLIEWDGYRPGMFEMMLEGYLIEELQYRKDMASPGSRSCGSPYAYVEKDYYGEVDAWCEGYTSETAARDCYERYMDHGASACRMYQKWKAEQDV